MISKIFRQSFLGLSSKTTRLFSTSTVVELDYKDVSNKSSDLRAQIGKAYSQYGNSRCLGILLIKNIPNYIQAREKLLPLSRQIAALTKQQKAQIQSEKYLYQIGWSHGVQKFQGKPDFLKGSFYANPLTDQFTSSLSIDKAKNLWPSDSIPDLEPAMKRLGQIMVNTGKQLSYHIDKYVKSLVPAYQDGQLAKFISNKQCTIARLLHYFPVKQSQVKQQQMAKEGEEVIYCGWHNDHSSLTGLTKAMYIDENGKEVQIKDPSSGLYIKSRNSQNVKVNIPADAVAYQIGETSQILSGGKLQATPHVVVTNPNTSGVSRNTMAVFMGPQMKQSMKNPEGTNIQDVMIEKDNIPSLKGRWNRDMTFQQFQSQTVNSYNNWSQDGK